jgi:hypothetical protein
MERRLDGQLVRVSLFALVFAVLRAGCVLDRWTGWWFVASIAGPVWIRDPTAVLTWVV